MSKSAKEQIRSNLEWIIGKEAKACTIWKGYNSETRLKGWHYTLPGLGSKHVYLGKNLQEAIDNIWNIEHTC